VDQYRRVYMRPTSHGPARGVATPVSNTAGFAVSSADAPRRMNIHNAKKHSLKNTLVIPNTDKTHITKTFSKHNIEMYYMQLDSFCEVSLPVGPSRRCRSFSTPALLVAGGRMYRRGL
jgi:hypothetical protein